MRFLFLCIIVLLCGCGSIREQNTLIKEVIRHTRDSVYVERIDTVIHREIVYEKSSSTGKDSSTLETSYAMSTAKITDDGTLEHIIENKDSANLPCRIVREFHSYCDTVTKYEYVDIYVEREKKAFLQDIIYPLGWAFICTILFIVIWLIKRRM